MCCFQQGPFKKLEIWAGGGVLELGNLGGRRGSSGLGNLVRKGGLKMFAIRRGGGVFFLE